MYPYDRTTRFHVPRKGSRTQVFPPEGLSNFSTKNVFQRPSIVSTYRGYSGKSFPKSDWLSMDPPYG